MNYCEVHAKCIHAAKYKHLQDLLEKIFGTIYYFLLILK
jgi:hypothetical protein